MDQRDVVEMARLVIIGVPHHPVDAVGDALVRIEARGAKPHPIALVDLGLVDAVRRGQHPAGSDQRAAAAVREVPFVAPCQLLLGPVGKVSVDLRLPRDALNLFVSGFWAVAVMGKSNSASGANQSGKRMIDPPWLRRIANMQSFVTNGDGGSRRVAPRRRKSASDIVELVIMVELALLLITERASIRRFDKGSTANQDERFGVGEIML